MSSFDITNQEELNVFMNELNKVVHSVTEFELETIANSSKSVKPTPTPTPTPSPKSPSSVKGMVVIDELNITTDADDKIKITQKPIETINVPIS